MKRIITLLMAAVIVTALCACSSQDGTAADADNALQANAGAQEVAQAEDDVNRPLESGDPAIPESTPKPVPTATPGADEPITYTAEDKIVIEYFDVEQNETVTKEYDTGGDESNKTAFDAVNEVFLKEVLGSEGVSINSVTFTDGNVFIDFTQSIYSINMGSAGEGALLDSIADAYMNNVEGVKGVYFSVDGGDYASGHIEIPANQAYKYND